MNLPLWSSTFWQTPKDDSGETLVKVPKVKSLSTCSSLLYCSYISLAWMLKDNSEFEASPLYKTLSGLVLWAAAFSASQQAACFLSYKWLVASTYLLHLCGRLPPAGGPVLIRSVLILPFLLFQTTWSWSCRASAAATTARARTTTSPTTTAWRRTKTRCRRPPAGTAAMTGGQRFGLMLSTFVASFTQIWMSLKMHKQNKTSTTTTVLVDLSCAMWKKTQRKASALLFLYFLINYSFFSN